MTTYRTPGVYVEELKSWGRISGSAEITAESSYETHGITKLFGLRQSFFLA